MKAGMSNAMPCNAEGHAKLQVSGLCLYGDHRQMPQSCRKQHTEGICTRVGHDTADGISSCPSRPILEALRG